MPTMTTIKVETGVRDRLRANAKNADLTMNEYLERVLEIEDRRAKVAAVRAAMAATPKALMDRYHAESEAWVNADLD